jgi:hypothetical protein
VTKPPPYDIRPPGTTAGPERHARALQSVVLVAAVSAAVDQITSGSW